MIITVFITIVIFTVAIIWAAYQSFLGMTLNLEVKPLEVIGLAVNVSIAILLQYYLANKATDSRSEKDILMANVTDVLSALRSCRDTLSTGQGKERFTPRNVHCILQSFRQLSNRLTDLEDSLHMSQFSELGTAMGEIWKACDGYKYAGTGAPFPKTASGSQQDRAFRNLSSLLQALAFNINNKR